MQKMHGGGNTVANISSPRGVVATNNLANTANSRGQPWFDMQETT
jgi:hypothetical protein